MGRQGFALVARLGQTTYWRRHHAVSDADGQNYNYRGISPKEFKPVSTSEGLLSMGLIKRKFTNTVGVPKKFGSKQSKIQKSSFLFPDLQETMNAAAVFEFMKILYSNLFFK